MDIQDVVFRCAALRPRERPQEWFPQIAIAGRSNVGKSSLINWLFRRQLARVAKAPGRTRALNFFLVNRRFFLVDLPGYGYAKVSRDLRAQWGRELEAYLASEERLAGVITLLDVRHGATTLDLEVQALLAASGRRVVVVLTKGDKVGRGQRAQMRQTVQRELGIATPPTVVSVHTGEGRRELLGSIDQLVSEWHRA